MTDTASRSESSDPDMRAKKRSRLKRRTDLSADADKPELSKTANETIDTREAIGRVDSVLRSLSADPDFRAKLLAREKFKSDLKAAIRARADMARKEAQEQARDDIARNALAKGLQLADIAAVTGLTTEEIERLSGVEQAETREKR
ncbi:MAG: hypothetical protein LBJ64_10015 [Deltaproteobacteria bacterium]|jgi:hypothetical protein|nr:hypothetical protein [Deltaproteobacteria bacterium]